jgi:hypothetical protein
MVQLVISMCENSKKNQAIAPIIVAESSEASVPPKSARIP